MLLNFTGKTLTCSTLGLISLNPLIRLSSNYFSDCSLGFSNPWVIKDKKELFSSLWKKSLTLPYFRPIMPILTFSYTS